MRQKRHMGEPIFVNPPFLNTESAYDANTQSTELFNKAKDFEKKLKRAQATAVTPAACMKKRMAEEN